VKSEIKKLDGAKREISIEASGDVVKNKFADVFSAIAKEAKVPGFRVGHVPRDILEKHYSSYAHEQVLKELVPELYDQAVAKEGLEVIELPEISDVKLDRAALSFRARVEVRPAITLDNYKGIKVTYKKISILADELKRGIDALKESHKADTLDDNFARGLGYPNLAELEKAVERQMLTQKENAQRQAIENALIENLLKGLDFKAPQSMVKRQLEELLRQAKLDLALRGVSREKIEEQENALSQQLEAEARNQVRVYLVLGHIAKKENIPIDDHMPRKVMELLLREADWQEAA
jgi:FKBP-type peptidyl-prolyl cis-trans isomerase (trigger factor)